MPIEGDYLGMRLVVGEDDPPNHAFFQSCGRGEFRLQQWESNGLLSYPPTHANPWDATLEHEWVVVEGRGTVVSYNQVMHLINPAFRDGMPYLVLLVELDVQRGQPTEHEAIRVVGNLVTADGELAPPEMVEQVGIGSRMKLVLKQIGEDFGMPHWTLDTEADQPTPWRYPASG